MTYRDVPSATWGGANHSSFPLGLMKTTFLMLVLGLLAKISFGFEYQPSYLIGPYGSIYVRYENLCMMWGPLPNPYSWYGHVVPILPNSYFFGNQGPAYEMPRAEPVEQEKKTAQPEPKPENEIIKPQEPEKVKSFAPPEPLSYAAAAKTAPKKIEQPYMKSFNRNKFEIIKTDKALECSKAVFYLSKNDKIKADPRFIEVFADQLKDPGDHKKGFSFLFNEVQDLLDLMTFMPERSLIKLSLHGEWVDDEILAAIGRKFKGSEVSYLDLSHCANITDEGFKNLTIQLEKISYVNLSFCKKITGKYLYKLSSEHILYLELEECSISDETLLGFKNLAKNLRSLNLNACKITGKAFQAFAAMFGPIRYIYLKGCFSISPKDLAEAIRPIKDLLIFVAPR